MSRASVVMAVREVNKRLDLPVEDISEMTPQQELANAIIVQAAEDYRELSAMIDELEEQVSRAIGTGQAKALRRRLTQTSSSNGRVIRRETEWVIRAKRDISPRYSRAYVRISEVRRSYSADKSLRVSRR